MKILFNKKIKKNCKIVLAYVIQNIAHHLGQKEILATFGWGEGGGLHIAL